MCRQNEHSSYYLRAVGFLSCDACEIFGEGDVLREHREDVYPFRCDFYIISRSLFIELNASWTHGRHWFDEDNVQDMVTLEEWYDKNSRYYNNAIEVWTVRDVLKRDKAAENNLNYLTFWRNDLSDFHEWIDVDCPDGKDWERMYSWKSVS